MRTLIYVPIIHSSADMGSLGNELKHKNTDGSTGNKWQKHSVTVNDYWDVIESYFENINIGIKGVKIYQDGMFADGEMAIKIINEGIKSGSKNSKIISKLIDRGAILMQTEDFGMVKAEYDGLQSILKSKNNITKLFWLLRYKISKSLVLIRRDKFIAGRIAESLEQNETGILFIGAYHNIIKRLPEDITVIELKETAKIRKYQKTIHSNKKIKKLQNKQLAEYLVKRLN